MDGKAGKGSRVDRQTGFFTDAVKAAKSRGKLDEDAAVVYIEPEKPKSRNSLPRLAVRAPAIAKLVDPSIFNGGLPGLNAKEGDILPRSELAVRISDASHGGSPVRAIAHCLCADPL